METLESLSLYLAPYWQQILIILLSGTGLILVVLIFYWLHNRRRFRELSHQIPASVVKNYLDSIIQNSTALKSSLFRGGGTDVGDGIPSVVPVNDLAGGGVSADQVTIQELNQKRAEVSSLNSLLTEKEGIIRDLEQKMSDLRAAASSGDSSDQIALLNKEIDDLKKQLAAASASSGGDDATKQQLSEITKERDELKERLMEYEIIEEDLANLKRLQQENEQLKKALEEAGGSAPAPVAEAAAPPAAEPAPEPEPTPEPEPAPAAEPAPEAEDDFEAAMAAAIDDGAPPAAEAPKDDGAVPENSGEQKSADELLNEFEKMLG